ncbi:sugar ABC transporter permease [Planomonospora parontospora subsp. parontospora]|uniref:Sugar ABC transporter permease n=2 Tax=Planomonospora parontospora TaxID=58119 RepID=A0AA37BDF6_9ACTN|nr:carbohydrate ABC transporter permease [Planomonospora parontospora]GGK54419.1 sugar ABC transporter permease [Planomonospora parontospora]GII07514.1 sugar ABC transporter permease [Planomonospora parontospora subsp. parontospora]
MATASSRPPVLYRRRISRGAKHLLLIGFGLVMLYPLLWMISSSLKPEELIFREPGLIPSQFTLDNYFEGWDALAHPFGYYLWNSAVITALSVIGNLMACSLAAYAFARLNFPLQKLWFALMIGTIMLPLHVVIVPQYIMFSQLDMINTIWPLILPKFLAHDSFFIFLMVQFIRTLPRELDEAASIDGAGYWRTFFRVILPLCTPALTTTAIFTFIWTWNDFFSQLLYLNNPDNFTVPVALRTFLDSSGESSWGPMFAMSIIALGPIFGFFLAGQKYLIRGMATTGLK